MIWEAKAALTAYELHNEKVGFAYVCYAFISCKLQPLVFWGESIGASIKYGARSQLVAYAMFHMFEFRYNERYK